MLCVFQAFEEDILQETGVDYGSVPLHMLASRKLHPGLHHRQWQREAMSLLFPTCCIMDCILMYSVSYMHVHCP